MLKCQRLVNDKYGDTDDHRIQQDSHNQASAVRFHPNIDVISIRSVECHKTEPDEKQIPRHNNYGNHIERCFQQDYRYDCKFAISADQRSSCQFTARRSHIHL